MNLKQVKKRIFRNENADIWISSRFGYRPVFGDYHYGVDYAPQGKTVKSKSLPLYPVTNGIVYKTGYDSTSGNYIFIKYPTLGYMSFYCHLRDKPLVKKGDKVKTTTKVGVTGTTGHSTGIHLHLGFKRIKSYSPLSVSNWVDPEKVPLKFYRTTTELVNFRKKPSLKADVITEIKEGEEVKEIIRNYKEVDGYMWDKVKYKEETGYIASEYLK